MSATTGRTRVFALLVLGAACSSAGAATWYVDDSVAASGAGTGWTAAFKTLPEGLTAAVSGDEVRVGQGVYRPTVANGVRTLSFVMKSGVAVRGGYAGFGASSPNTRDFVNTPSILSGDLNGNDTSNFINNTENSINVVTVPSTVTTAATLEGFTITGGNSNAAGSLTAAGGAIAILGAIDVRSCLITLNTGSQNGSGAVNCRQAASNVARFFRCTFSGNVVQGSGTGGNVDIDGAQGPVDVVNCGFFGNNAFSLNANAGISVASTITAPVTMTNCVFSGNRSYGSGCALRLLGGIVSITNCTIANNSTGTVGSVGGGISVGTTTCTLTNSIVWGNYADIDNGISVLAGGAITPTYCDLQDALPGAGNISLDPKFTDADGPDNILGTSDDDLSLQNGYPGSPCIDTANAAALPADIADLDGDANVAEALPRDFLLNTRRIDNALTDAAGNGGTPPLDMGAYENTLSSFTVPAVIYVDATSTAAAGVSPSSWLTPLKEVRSAAYIASLASAPASMEIRIAQGLYRSLPPGMAALSDVIVVPSGVTAILGGYAGSASTSPDTRDPSVFESIITGDTNGDDLPGFVNYDDNAVQPVQLNSTIGLLVDGLVFTGINGPASTTSTIYPGVFGGLNGTFRRCTFRANRGPAGILYSGAGNSVVSGCTFVNNQCVGFVPSQVGAPIGGVLAAFNGSVYVSNCGFFGNTAPGNPVAAFFGTVNCTMVNCVASGNIATGAAGGGAVRRYGTGSGLFSMVNCTFANNQSQAGPGSVIASAPLANGTMPTFDNCVLWGNTAPGGNAPVSGVASINTSIVQGGYSGTGNINADPQFADADGPDNTIGTTDDNVAPATGLSPMVDTGVSGVLPLDTADLDGDSITNEPLPLDFLRYPRVVDGNDDVNPIPDKGAVEYQRNVQNLSALTTHASILGAMTFAAPNQRLLAPTNQFAIEPTIDFLGKSGLTLTSTAEISQPAGGVWTLGPGCQVAAAPNSVMQLGGEVRAPSNAYTTLSAFYVFGQTTSALNLFNGSTMVLTGTLSTVGSTRLYAGSSLSGTNLLSDGGTLTALSGSTLTGAQTVRLNGPSTLLGATVIGGGMTVGAATNWTGTSISVPTLTINAAGRFTGSGNVYANTTNSGRIYTIGNSVFVGNLTNNAGGFITVQIGTATLIGTLVNNGTINGVLSNAPLPPPGDGASEDEVLFYRTLMASLGDSSDRTSAGDGMFIRGDYVAGVGASLSLPDAVWRLTVAGSYDAAINSNANYDMRQAELVMAKPDTGTTTIEAMSLDRGNVAAGLDRTLAGSFPIGTLRIGAGAAVSTADARDNVGDGQAACEAVYCDKLIIESGAVLSTPSCRVYYRTLTNNGGTIANPTNMLRIPPPCGGADFNSDGVVNTSDLVFFLGRFGQPATPGTLAERADFNADGVVNTVDLVFFLGRFGSVCPQ
jgi:hypothetical protein